MGLMESTIGLYKVEVIDHERSTWSSWRQVEAATAEWVYWYNHQRLHGSLADIPRRSSSRPTMMLTKTAATPLQPDSPSLHHSQADSIAMRNWPEHAPGHPLLTGH